MSDTTTYVLLVEDNDGDALLVEEAIEGAVGDDGTVRLARVGDVGSAVAVLEDDSPDCVLLDLGLPDVAGDLEALTNVLRVDPTVAVVVLTGRNDHDLASRAIAAGAQDYLVKTADPSGAALLRAIEFAAQRGRTTAALRTTRDELADFAERVAHDMRSPLAAIVGFASLLLSGKFDDDEATRRMVLQRIADVSSAMARMVDGMLEYARDPGTVRHEVALDDVLDWVVPLVTGQLEAADGQLERGDLHVVWAHEPALRTVVLNLLGNAVKYRAPGRRLLVRVWSERADGRVVLRVQDNGRGIPADDRERVFEPGRRLHHDVDVPGIGLGLSAAQRIVQQLDGEVWIEDAGHGDEGVCVCVALPVAADRGATA